MSVERSTVYCTACKQQVNLTFTAAPAHGGEANLPDGPELVCLTFGSRCAAETCPVSGLPSVVMGVRLARSGMDPEVPWRTVEMRCGGCERITTMEVVDNVHAFCTDCGTTNRWFKLNLGDEEYLVAMEGQGSP